MDYSNRFNKYRITLIIIALVSIFLPFQRFTFGGSKYRVYLFDNYSTWAVMVLVVAIAGYSLWMLSRKKSTFWIIDILSGSLLAGWVLFTVYHTFTLFPDQDSTHLAVFLHASATPGEGLLLLFLSGCWLILQGIKNQQK